jgi:predicted nucleic acid-binding protein
LKAIADTGFVVALVNSDDIHHQWALDVGPRITTPLLTCEAVLSESAFHLHSAEVVLEMVESGFLEIAFDASAHLAALRTLAARYSDRNPDFADLCLIRMSELFPHHTVITNDEHDFQVYRRNKRDMIPVLCPPRSRQ